MKHRLLQSIFVWAGITLGIFTFFYWLFQLGMPDAALEFSIGVTFIIMAGLLLGWYLTPLWVSADKFPPKILFIILPICILSAIFGIGFLVNKMIGNTQFIDFFFTILLLFLMSSCIGTFINLVGMGMSFKLRTAQITMAQSNSELQLLQSQLSPHFLFNTLNNIYGLSMSDPQKVPTLLLRLSSLLRYSIYDTKELFVPLQHELEYINNYIEFEKVRLGDRLVLQSNLHMATQHSHKRIAPMLLIVFIENAFKHSKNDTAQKIYIDIDLQVSSEFILFEVKNSRHHVVPNYELDKKHTGFGLDSVQKRLSALYQDKHTLKIQKLEQEFIVSLTLKN